jgi:hypothetical protein
MTKIWKVEIGYNYDNINVEAENVEEAIEKVKKYFKKKMEKEPENFWISKIELLAENEI